MVNVEQGVVTLIVEHGLVTAFAMMFAVGMYIHAKIYTSRYYRIYTIIPLCFKLLKQCRYHKASGGSSDAHCGKAYDLAADDFLQNCPCSATGGTDKATCGKF